MKHFLTLLWFASLYGFYSMIRNAQPPDFYVNWNLAWTLLIVSSVSFLLRFGWIISALFNYTFGDDENERYSPPIEKPLDVETRFVNGHTIEIVVKHRTFRIRKAEDGRADIREKRRGREVGRWLTGAPNAAKFGQTQNETIISYLKDIIKNEKKIWGDE